MAQSKIPYRFPEQAEITDIAEFNKVSKFATQEIETMKNLLLHELTLIRANNDSKLDFESRNFKDAITTLFNADPNAPGDKGNSIRSFKQVVENIAQYSQKYKLSKENTEKLLTDMKTDVNNFKNMLLSSEEEAELLLARHRVNKLIDSDNKILIRDNTGAKFVDVDKDLGKRIAEHINASSAQLILNSNEKTLKLVTNRHLASLIPEGDIKTEKTRFTEENIRDTAGFISNFCEVFDRRDDIAITFYKSAKNGVNKVKELCKDEKHLPEILANLFFIAQDQDNRFDLEHVGLYLGDEGDINKKTLEYFTALHDFRNNNFLDSLRTYLQSFKLPGEAQKIDRVMEAFSNEYIKQNPHSEVGGSDNAYVLSFATIMLSTDLHNTQKNSKKMTVEQFKKNLRGVKNNQDFDSTFLDELYKSIKDNRLRCDFISESPGYEIRTSELVKDNTYNKLSDYLHNHNSTAKDIFPNLQDADKWQITSQSPKSWLNKFMGYQGNIVLSNKDKNNEKVTIQVYEPSILSQWFLSRQHRVIIQPNRGAINGAAMIAASIKPEVTSIKSTYNYEKEELKAEYANARSALALARSVPPHVQNIIKNNEKEIIKPLYKAHFIEDDPMGHEMHKRSNTRKYYVNPKKGNSDRGIT